MQAIGQIGKQITRKFPSWIDVHPKIVQALHDKTPVVALESTIITHGMPYPQNHETTKALIDIVETQSDGQVLAAPICLWNGQAKVGMDLDELERLAQIGQKAMKCSTRDMAYILARGKLKSGFDDIGATTVSSTLYIASLLNIPLFCTGGIGGVHRNAQNTFDISADLMELGTPLNQDTHGVGVVCAGAKSVLDIGLTLEYLETQGVPVVTLSQDKDAMFPSFYTPESEHKSPLVISTIEEVATALQMHRAVRNRKGMVIAAPIPSENAECGKLINDAIFQALDESVKLGISGKETTPYLLKRISELTKGESLKANIALVKNNAAVARDIALKLSNSGVVTNKPVFVGAAAVDIITKLKDKSDNFLETSSPSTTRYLAGGVARNAAEACQRVLKIPKSVHLLSPVSVNKNGAQDDQLSSQYNNMGYSFVSDPQCDFNSPIYNAILDSQGKLIVAGASMELLERPSMRLQQLIINQFIQLIYKNSQYQNGTQMICFDANLPHKFTIEMMNTAKQHDAFIAFEPTSVPKCTAWFSEVLSRNFTSLVDLWSPNIDELLAVSKLITSNEAGNSNFECKHFNQSGIAVYDQGCKDISPQIVQALRQTAEFIPITLLKMGGNGVAICQKKDATLKVCHYQPATIKDIVNVTGAGDSLVGTFIAKLYQKSSMESKSIKSILSDQTQLNDIMVTARKAAELSLQVEEAVNPAISNL
ncbi:hypothetical protein MIR68_001662 [Amoeboaphelidium protococcarum]|nr:hypothetical protein MIR68_001662 [Amoeboaphelidium protococcarum]